MHIALNSSDAIFEASHTLLNIYLHSSKRERKAWKNRPATYGGL